MTNPQVAKLNTIMSKIEALMNDPTMDTQSAAEMHTAWVKLYLTMQRVK